MVINSVDSNGSKLTFLERMDQVRCISLWELSLVKVWLRLRNGILQLREGVSYMDSIGTQIRLGYRITKTE